MTASASFAGFETTKSCDRQRAIGIASHVLVTSASTGPAYTADQSQCIPLCYRAGERHVKVVTLCADNFANAWPVTTIPRFRRH